MNIQNFVKRELKARNMSQRQFAKLIGVHFMTVSNWMLGRTKSFNSDTRGRIAKKLKIDIKKLR